MSVQTGPWVIDTHELGRRPGHERTYHLRATVPAQWGYDVFGVPEGSEVDLELRLEAVMDGVLATGSTTVTATGECVRCLEQVEEDLDLEIQELYLYDRPSDEEEAEETQWLEGDLLDLEPTLRDAVVFALPHHPLCDPDCPGLCPDCGARIADDPDHTHGAAVDPRWSALTTLIDSDTVIEEPKE
ncbi:MAG: YceD family protein [Aeromicrobium sp.]|uniref:YceD family protein n=1 Tax=Aeromicrobium sp. TaxID=1871063 RepID=UPI0039E720DD